MHNIGDRLQHKKSGNIGKVVAYGHWIINDVYLTTLKVLLDKETGETNIVEDVVTEWIHLEDYDNQSSRSTSLSSVV
jgi:hypothetical protein